MQTLSKAILDQLSSDERPLSKSSTSPGRSIRSCAPVSSSRHDPLPNDKFPAPLPPIQLPYELSLLDNVFVNPMAAHNKASDYTNGIKARSKKDVKPNPGITTGAGRVNNSMAAPSAMSMYNDAPQGFPPGAFGGNGSASGAFNQNTSLTGIHPYAIAAQVDPTRPLHYLDPSFTLTEQPTNTQEALKSGMGTNSSSSMGMTVNSGMGNNNTGFGNSGAGIGMSNTGLGQMNGDPTMGNTDPNNFDILNFLMDEESGLGGTTTWDAMDVPADFSLWS